MAEKRKDSKRRVLREGEYQRANGSFEYKYRDKIGKRHSVYAKTLDELREKETELLRDKLNKVTSTNITVNELYNRWKEVKRGIKDNTFRCYQYTYNLFVFEELGRMKISKLKKSDVRSFYNKLYDAKGLKPNTIDSVHTVLHQVLELGVEDGYLLANPSDSALKELRKAHGSETAKRKALTVKEQAVLESFLASSKKYQRWRPIITFMLYTGLRVGELIALTWGDVDLDKDEIEIKKTMVYYKRDGGKLALSINTPKTESGKRKLPLTSKAKQALLEEKKFQEMAGVKSSVEIDGVKDFIFVNRFGSCHTQNGLNKVLKRLIRDCNLNQIDKGEIVFLPNISCHHLRHTFATRMCEADVNIKALQEILGHSDFDTTMNIYAEAGEEFKKKEMVKFEKAYDNRATDLRTDL